MQPGSGIRASIFVLQHNQQSYRDFCIICKAIQGIVIVLRISFSTSAGESSDPLKVSNNIVEIAGQLPVSSSAIGSSMGIAICPEDCDSLRRLDFSKSPLPCKLIVSLLKYFDVRFSRKIWFLRHGGKPPL